MKRGWQIPVGAAALLGLLLLGAHLLGWREHVSVLSGTVPGAGGTVGQGVAYALAWFAAVVGAPILLLATAIYASLVRWLERAPTPAGPAAPDRPAS